MPAAERSHLNEIDEEIAKTIAASYAEDGQYV